MVLLSRTEERLPQVILGPVGPVEWGEAAKVALVERGEAAKVALVERERAVQEVPEVLLQAPATT